MGQITQRLQYRCDDDCLQSGCPGHEATLEFNSVANIYTFDDGNGSKCFFDQSTMGALVKMLKIFAETRADTVKI